MNKHQLEIEEYKKQVKTLNDKIALCRRRDKIEIKVKNGAILTSEEINLLPPADRQKFLMKSMRNKNKKYGIK
jgi:uncharacterized coiled-coil DUF342 family protein